MIAIVACDKKGGIGLNGGLPWPKIKEDLKWFKEFTMGECLVMGRKTFESTGILPGRSFLVLRNGPLFDKSELVIRDNEIVVIKTNLDGLDATNKVSIVCGGAQIYKLLVPKCSELFVTHVNGEYECDTYFPYSFAEIEAMFPKKEQIREFEGGHKVIKYYK